MSEAILQWKGTNACLDFYCDCGEDGHFDGYLADYLRCPSCGTTYHLSASVSVTVALAPPRSQDIEVDE